jgi:hypothetical protein
VRVITRQSILSSNMDGHAADSDNVPFAACLRKIAPL